MTRRFGDRATFAIEVGEPQSAALRTVDLWAGGTWLTRHDNCAYLPTLRHYMQLTVEHVRRRDVPACPFPGRTPEEIFDRLHRDETELRQQHWFLNDWAELTDGLAKYAYLDTDLVFVFSFRQPETPDAGGVFVARIRPDDFVATTEAALDFLA